MRLLLTRPMPEGAASAAQLRAMGHKVSHMPVLTIVQLVPEIPDGPFDALLATSANAFSNTTIAAWLARLGPAQAFVVGEKTLIAARHTSDSPDLKIQHAPDVRSLVQLLHTRPKSRFLYLAGRERKPVLEASLAAKGHKITTIVTYIAKAVEAFDPEVADDMHNGKIDSILHYSRRSVGIFLHLAQNAGLMAQVQTIRHFCLSADVAAPLHVLAQPHVTIAATPDEDGMLAQLAMRNID